MWPNPQFPVDMVTFTDETLNRKLHFLCSDIWVKYETVMKVIRKHLQGTKYTGVIFLTKLPATLH